MAAIGNATRHGFLVREGDALERLSCVSHLTFDKTGTLTCGDPRVAAVRSFLPELPEQELYRYAACAELRSEHPLGKAIVRCYRKDSVRELPQPEQFRMIPGRGVRAVEQGKELLAGNLELFRENGVELSVGYLAGECRSHHPGSTGCRSGSRIADRGPWECRRACRRTTGD